MGRRDPDPRPPVEVLGAEEPTTTLHRVEVGHRPAPSTRAKRALLAAAVIAVLLTGLALGDSDDESAGTPPGGERDNSAKLALRESTTTTRQPRRPTTTTLPQPVLAGADVRVLLFSGGRAAELLDLRTGVSTQMELDRNVFVAVPVRGGVVASEARTAIYRPIDGPPVELGVADLVHAVPGNPGAVWLVADASELAGAQAILVGLDGTLLGGPIVASDGWIVGASAGGLIVQAGGRMYETRPDRSIHAIASGEALGVSEGRLVARRCDDTATCRVEVFDEGLRSSQAIDVPAGTGRYYGASVVVQPGGAKAAVQLYGPAGSTVAIVDLGGGPHRLIEGVDNVSAVAWLPDDLGLLLVKRSEILRAYERGDVLIVEQLRDVGGDQAVVIPG